MRTMIPVFVGWVLAIHVQPYVSKGLFILQDVTDQSGYPIQGNTSEVSRQ